MGWGDSHKVPDVAGRDITPKKAKPFKALYPPHRQECSFLRNFSKCNCGVSMLEELVKRVRKLEEEINGRED